MRPIEYSPICFFSDVFFMPYCGDGLSGKNNTDRGEELFSPYHAGSTCYPHYITDDAKLHYLFKVVLARIFHSNAIVFLFPYSIL